MIYYSIQDIKTDTPLLVFSVTNYQYYLQPGQRTPHQQCDEIITLTAENI